MTCHNSRKHIPSDNRPPELNLHIEHHFPDFRKMIQKASRWRTLSLSVQEILTSYYTEFPLLCHGLWQLLQHSMSCS